MRLCRIFSDGAVLQRDQLIPVWGCAQPDRKIEADLAGKTAFSRSDSDGHFLLYLPPLPPGGPWELKVSSGNESVAQVCASVTEQSDFMRDLSAVADMPVSSANLRQWPDSIELMESLPPIFIAGAAASAGQKTVETRS